MYEANENGTLIKYNVQTAVVYLQAVLLFLILEEKN